MFWLFDANIFRGLKFVSITFFFYCCECSFSLWFRTSLVTMSSSSSAPLLIITPIIWVNSSLSTPMYSITPGRSISYTGMSSAMGWCDIFWFLNGWSGSTGSSPTGTSFTFFRSTFALLYLILNKIHSSIFIQSI